VQAGPRRSELSEPCHQDRAGPLPEDAARLMVRPRQPERCRPIMAGVAAIAQVRPGAVSGQHRCADGHDDAEIPGPARQLAVASRPKRPNRKRCLLHRPAMYDIPVRGLYFACWGPSNRPAVIVEGFACQSSRFHSNGLRRRLVLPSLSRSCQCHTPFLEDDEVSTAPNPASDSTVAGHRGPRFVQAHRIHVGCR